MFTKLRIDIIFENNISQTCHWDNLNFPVLARLGLKRSKNINCFILESSEVYIYIYLKLVTQLYNRIILIWRQCNREKIILTLVKLTNTYKKVKRIQIYIPLVGSWSPPVVPEKMKNHIFNQFHEISSWVSLQQLFIKTFRRHTKYAYLNQIYLLWVLNR